MNTGECFEVSAIRLDAITGAAWDLRGTEDGTGDLLFAQESLDLETARSSPIDELQVPPLAPLSPERLLHGLEVSGDGARVPHLPHGAGFGDGHVDHSLCSWSPT
jgi:hypothetical protein